MRRARVGFVILGVVALVVVGLAAATLSTTTADVGGDPGAGGGDGTGAPPPGQLPLGTHVFEYAFLGLLFLLTAGAVVAALRYPVSAIKESLRAVVALGVLTVFGMLFFASGFAGGGPEPAETTPRTNESASGAGSGDGEGAGTAAEEAVDALSDDPELLLLAGLGLLTLAVVGAAVLAGESEQPDESFAASDPADGNTLRAIGRVAGEAADRLAASAAVDNEVFRAWKRMTDLLDVDDPDARTPGEFRRAAVEAGMAPGDVDELTDLFEAVRYGARDVTDDREQRAVDALRRIESTYTGGSE
jgi:hypothetical protein